MDRVRVRYWAAARAAAGRDTDEVTGETLAEVLDAVRSLHADKAKFAQVVGVCSVLVGERPVGSRDPATVRIGAGETVELLPPFAGG
ncbi:MAG TPA: MoaD/ThiS family protein [Nocardioidaceae bacterium]|nr:MoaD/ThiS family protein [Nocardioidaceae bacterium]